MQRAGVTVRAVPMTASSKTAAFAELRSLIYTGQLELPDYPPLLAELRRLRTRFTAGSASVVNPRVGGSHGDLAQALAMAVWDRGEGGVVYGESSMSDSGRFDPQSYALEDSERSGGYAGQYRDGPLDGW